MKVIATELKKGDIIKKDGYTWEIITNPKDVDFEIYKSSKQVWVHVKPISYNSTSSFVSQWRKDEINEAIKTKPWTELKMFRKTTMIKTF